MIRVYLVSDKPYYLSVYETENHKRESSFILTEPLTSLDIKYETYSSMILCDKYNFCTIKVRTHEKFV